MTEAQGTLHLTVGYASGRILSDSTSNDGLGDREAVLRLARRALEDTAVTAVYLSVMEPEAPPAAEEDDEDETEWR